MSDIPWKELIELLRFGLWIVLYISVIGLFKVIITEVCSRHCKHCGKKV